MENPEVDDQWTEFDDHWLELEIMEWWVTLDG